MKVAERSPKERLEEFTSSFYCQQRSKLLKEFNSKFPDESSCWTFIYSEMRIAGHLRCSRCHSEETEVQAGRKLVCNSCRKTRQVTAGTLFQGVKKVRAWLFAIWIIENSFYVSSKWLGEAIGVAQSSALQIIKTTLLILEKDKFEGSAIALETLRFRLFFCKRSILTPALKKPVDEALDCESPDNESNSSKYTKEKPPKGHKEESRQVPKKDTAIQRKKSTIEDYILGKLANGPMTLDEILGKSKQNSKEILVAITDLEFDGLLESLQGGKFKLPDAKDSRLTKTEDQNFNPIEFSRQNNQSEQDFNSLEDIHDAAKIFMRITMDLAKGVSRKYLSLFVSCANEIVLASKRGSFLERCLSAGYIGYKTLRNYVSPNLLEFAISSKCL
ncbi:MAG: hypothetical protein K2Y32_02765 [Candidatus Obscuribacterales bacterium]|nr:hypothetical protein [Candidatus Obscuribacterales bacterium]